MTTTTIVSAVALGTSTNVGDFVQPTKTTLQDTTTTVQIVVSITRGVSIPVEGTLVRVYYSCSPVSYSSALVGAQATAQGSRFVDVILKTDRPTAEVTSELLVTAAGYFYCWLTMPRLAVTAAVTVNLEELP